MATDTAPDKIDVNNVPTDAVNTGLGTWSYRGEFYRMNDGVKVSNNGAMDYSGNVPSVDPFSSLKNPFLSQIAPYLPRGGLILLGAALCIVGIAMLISGTKTAQTIASVVPVVGKVI